MRFRREPEHVRLAREGGIDRPERPLDPRPRWGEVGIHGVARAREWDAVVTVESDLDADGARFVALPDGSLLVEEGPADVGALAAAVERSLEPPYRAEAVRRDGGTWAVAARRLRVVEVPGLDGDLVELTASPEGKRATVDGFTAFGALPRLEQLLDGADGYVRAERLDGDLFEVRVERL